MMERDHAADDLTLYLTTKKGTQYALTIKDKQKFIDLFYSQIYSNFSKVPFDNLADLQTKEVKYEAAKVSYKNLYDKYFKAATGTIKQTDTNNNNVLTEFLKFMKEADAGIMLFDASPINSGDPPFQDFREIELINGVPVRKNPC